MTRLVTLIMCIGSIACSDEPSTFELSVGSPERGHRQADGSVVVTGQVVGDVDVVTVNDTAVSLDTDGGFSTPLDLSPGTHLIEVEAVRGDDVARDVRSVLVGEDQTGPVADAVILQIGDTGLRDVAREIGQAIDINAIRDSMTEQAVKDSGTENGCDRDLVAVTSTNTELSPLIYGLLDGLAGESTFNPFSWSFSATYSDSSCALVTDSFTFNTEELHVLYSYDLAMDGGAVIPTLVDPTIDYHHPFELDDSQLDPDVAARVTSGVEDAIANRLIDVSTPHVVDAMASWVNSFSQESVVSAGGAEVQHSLAPTAVAGAWSLRLESAVASGGYVATPGVPPELNSTYASMAIADDAVNQLLAAAWAEGAFGGQLDGTNLEMLTPPFLHVRDGSPVIVFGDWFARGSSATSVFAGTASLRLETTENDEFRLVTDTVSIERVDLSSSLELGLETELRGRLDALLGALSVRLAAYAWPAVEMRAVDGYLIIDTAL